LTGGDDTSFLIGLIGGGIQASRTPRMHEREAAAQGLRLVYKLIDLDVLGLTGAALPDLLTAAERLGFDGLNITHPCKQSVLPLLHMLSDDARSLAAVNTVQLRDGQRIGHNTDWFGFAEAMQRNLADAPRDRVVQFGAGGAGSAVAYAALVRGVRHLSIMDVVAAKAERLAAALGGRFGRDRVTAIPDAPDAVRRADGVINATPIGMESHPGMAFPAAWLRPSLWVADVIYFPMETELLRRARALGCRTMDGGGMAVFQAVEAFRLFTGRPADPDRMLGHFRSFDAT
jgi:shikimate dehydrogenase